MTDDTTPAARVSPDEVERRVALVEGAMGAAGYEVDEDTRELSRRVAAEELTGDQAVAIALAQISARE